MRSTPDAAWTRRWCRRAIRQMPSLVPSRIWRPSRRVDGDGRHTGGMVLTRRSAAAPTTRIRRQKGLNEINSRSNRKRLARLAAPYGWTASLCRLRRPNRKRLRPERRLATRRRANGMPCVLRRRHQTICWPRNLARHATQRERSAMSATPNARIANDAAGAHSLHRLVSWLAGIFLGPTAPPPGCRIVTNGKRYRWEWIDGGRSWVNRWTYRGACRAAWRYGVLNKEEQWKPANAELCDRAVKDQQL